MTASDRAALVLPTGTVTFLFSDIQGSTRLLRELGDGYAEVLAQHRRVLRAAFAAHDGVEMGTEGDSFFVAFARASDAVAAAAEAQRGLEGGPVRVRMGLHTGEPLLTAEGYVGMVVHRAARIAAVGHGGQVLLSEAVATLVADRLPLGVSLRDLGRVRLKDLTSPEQVYQILHSELQETFPALRSLEATPNNLPQQLTSFVGREKAMAELEALLAKTRLLTLTGAGGAGKTRLSLQVAAAALDEFPDGAWLTELAALTDPALMPQTVATVLGLREESGKAITQTLVEHLKTRQMLLVLDNCEHLLAACATLADALLQHCPEVKILATSREPLGIQGEQSYRVPSLSLPDRNAVTTLQSLSTYASVRLFIDRALAVRADFAVTNQNAPALASLCCHLDGIPLAIELAAARVRTLTVEEIDRKLDERFRLLTGGSKTALPRQQTLRALIDWSYDLLHNPEKLLLQRLSVFAGGWTLEAAETVCVGDGVDEVQVLDLLTSLADKSLVIAEQTDARSRFRLLETLRQYARDRLRERGEEAQSRTRHLVYFLELAEGAEPHLTGADQQAWLDRLGAEHDNLREALAWSQASGDDSAGLRLAGALFRYWSVRGHNGEGRRWLSGMLADSPDGQAAPRAKALNAAGVLAWLQGDYPAARALHQESLALRRELGDRRGIAGSLNNLGAEAYDRGDYAAARALIEEGLAILRELGDKWGIATALISLAMLLLRQGDYTGARVLLEESEAITRELGDRRGLAMSLGNQALVAQYQSDFPGAVALNEECLEIFRELGDRRGISITLSNLGLIAAARGDYVSAQALDEESLAIRRELGEPWGIALSLNNLGEVAFARGEHAAAQALFDESLAIRREIGERSGASASLNSLGNVARDRGDFPAARALYDECLAIQREVGDPSGIAMALSSLGSLARAQGDYLSARALHEESLGVYRRLGARSCIAESLEGLADVAAALPDAGRAARIWGGAERLREEIGSHRSPRDRPHYDRRVAAARAAMGDDAAFDRAWQEGRAWALEQVIELALDKTVE